MEDIVRLDVKDCRWRCDPQTLGFDSTADVELNESILGQDEAFEALRFGLKTRFKGDNIFVRGLSGFGRMSLIDQTIKEISSERARIPDYCYVRNFEEPEKPKLITLPGGTGRAFKDCMDEFSEFVQTELPTYLNSDIVKTKQKELVDSTQARIQSLGEPLEERLRAADLTLMPVQVGQNVVPMILPVINGNPIMFDELQKLRLEGSISESEFQALTEKIGGFEQELADLGEQITAVQIDQNHQLRELLADEAKRFVSARINAIKNQFDIQEISDFLEEILTDLITHRLANNSDDISRLYRINLVSWHENGDGPPVVSIINPSLVNLVGSIDAEFLPGANASYSDHLMIKPGALLQANGGFLIIDARDILSEPGAWSTLLRTLKTGLFELAQLDPFGLWLTKRLKPEPIPVDIKVILVGDPETHWLLDHYEPRFATLFKVLADFSDSFRRDEEGFNVYASMIASLVKRDSLKNFGADAVAMLIEHGARICSQKNRLTSKLGRVADIAREASFLATENGREVVAADDVTASIARARRRADLPSRRYRRLLTEGSIRIDTVGQCVGQINGLAVTSAGPLSYGFPTRITATIGPGSSGMVNIERESELSGAIHTKGFMILSGLLRHLLSLSHPMAFSGTVAFEQSYGGIDGDSASAAEFCCLMSALTKMPLRQDLAMTSAVDQKGNILPIGAVTEKIEGFYDVCLSVGLTGSQGVVIPETNKAELMLRLDVLDAIDQNRFHIYCIDSIQQALEVFTGQEFGDLDDPASGTLLRAARDESLNYWQTAKKTMSDSTD